jgi:DNA-binding NarL/FixJ family response regulator
VNHPATRAWKTPSAADGQGARLRVWVDDHHAIFRRGLLTCLAGDEFRVVGESAGLVPTPDPQTIDVLMFQADRARIRRTAPLRQDHSVELVAIVDSPTEELVYEAVDFGVSCVLLRSRLSPQKVVSSLRSVAEGNACMPAELLPQLLAQAASNSRADATVLTTRERQVLTLLAEGSDTREMADELCYSERTIKNVVHDMLVKMNCSNRTHAVAVAIRQGLI